MTRRPLASFLVFALAALPAGAQEDASDPLEYVFSVMNVEVGRETVVFDENGGWEAKGSFDLFGQRKGEYVATLRRGGEGVQWRVVATSAGKEATFEASLAGDRAKVGEKDLEIPEGHAPVFFENLVWACFFEIGRLDDLASGRKITAVLPSSAVTFPIAISKVEPSIQTVRGKETVLRAVSLTLVTVDAEMVVDSEGLPLRIDVPSQKLTVVLAGYESIRTPSTAPTSIVDSGPWRSTLSPVAHELVVEKKVMIPMADGVELAADVYRPAGDGKHPAILVRTPYGREAEGILKSAAFARRGYVVVAQDVRGRLDSEGEWFPLRNEAQDGSDTIDWIAGQPWSTGKVGMIGASYAGYVQWMAARTGNPHLVAIVPQVSPPDPDQNFPYEGGSFLLGAAWWAKVVEHMASSPGTLPSNVDWAKKLSTLPLGDLDKALGTTHPFLDEWLAHPPTDAEYWAPYRYQDRFADMKVATLNVSGWFDGDQPGAVQNFAGLRAAAASEEVRRSQYLIMGPWGHAFNAARRLGDVDFGPEGVVDLDAATLRFFDRYLKDVDNGIDREDPVLLFTMGANRWSREKDWPVPSTRFERLSLTSAGHAKKADGDGRLVRVDGAPAESPPDSFRYDPRDLPETLADFDDVVGHSATADHSKLPDREDFLDYTSPPLATDAEVLGPVEAVLSVSTDAADTDVVVAVYRLTPEDRLLAIAGGIQRLRYRLGRDEPVPPGTVVEVRVDCWATGTTLQKGDRIRLVVGSNAFPGYARNLNTLEPIATATEAVVATSSVHHDSERPSCLVLPIVPRPDAPGLAFEE